MIASRRGAHTAGGTMRNVRDLRPKRLTPPRKRGALLCFCGGGILGVLIDAPFYLANIPDEQGIAQLAGLFTALLVGSMCGELVGALLFGRGV